MFDFKKTCSFDAFAELPIAELYDFIECCIQSGRNGGVYPISHRDPEGGIYYNYWIKYVMIGLKSKYPEWGVVDVGGAVGPGIYNLSAYPETKEDYYETWNSLFAGRRRCRQLMRKIVKISLFFHERT